MNRNATRGPLAALTVGTPDGRTSSCRPTLRSRRRTPRRDPEAATDADGRAGRSGLRSWVLRDDETASAPTLSWCAWSPRPPSPAPRRRRARADRRRARVRRQRGRPPQRRTRALRRVRPRRDPRRPRARGGHEAQAGYAEARTLEVLQPSPDRIAPLADHPGAPWQVLPYERQLAVKPEQVEDALRRIGKLDGFSSRTSSPRSSCGATATSSSSRSARVRAAGSTVVSTPRVLVADRARRRLPAAVGARKRGPRAGPRVVPRSGPEAYDRRDQTGSCATS